MIRVVSLTQTCPACPSAWVGECEDGREFYARYRHEKLRVEIDRQVIFDRWIGDYGLLETSELRYHLRELVVLPPPDQIRGWEDEETYPEDTLIDPLDEEREEVKAIDHLAEDAVRQYDAGQTRSLREFAEAVGIRVAETVHPIRQITRRARRVVLEGAQIASEVARRFTPR